MCKHRWRPYLSHTPAKILSDFGPEVGPAILERNIDAICKAAVKPGRWIVLIGGSCFCIPVNNTLVPATFETFAAANSWLVNHLHALDLYFVKGDRYQPDCISYKENVHVAYRTFSPIADEHVVAEAIIITKDNEALLQETFLDATRGFRSLSEEAHSTC